MDSRYTKLKTNSMITGKCLMLYMALMLISQIAFADQVTASMYKESPPDQQRLLSVHFENKPLADVLHQLARKVDVGISYKTEIVPSTRVTYGAENTSIFTILDAVLEGTGLKVTLSANRKVILIKRKLAKAAVQQSTITGTVTDGSTGETLPGVNIAVKGTTTGTATDAQGQYELSVASLQDTLVFSFVGYQTRQVPINGRTEINIKMQSQAITGQEMVVIGYGTEQKQNITGAQSSIDFNNNELETQPVTDIGQALRGKAAGVRVIQTNGAPGSSSVLQIRGINSISANTTPLVVIDGNPMPGYNLNMLNPTDVKSVQILKDAASTAIYGSRASNGVILITTKSGKTGKMQVDVNYSYSNQQVMAEQPVMNGPQYAQASIEAAQNGWIDSGGDPNAPNTFAARGDYKYLWPKELENPENLPNTNWQDLIYRTAPMHKVNFRVSGANQGGTDYSLSGGYINQTGILIESDYKKYSFNSKINSKVNNWLKVGGMANLNYGNRRSPYGRIVEWAQQYPSIYPVFDKTTGHLGSPTTMGWPQWSDILFRPINGHPLYRVNDKLSQNRLNGIGNIFGDFSILQGLDFKTTVNVQYFTLEYNNYQAIEHNLGPTNYTQGVKNVNGNKTISYNWQNRLTYINDFNNGHHVNVTLGYEYNKFNNYSSFAERTGYDNDLTPYLNAGKNVTGASEGTDARVLMSIFGRLNYNFKDRYLASISYREDGSSNFGPNNKWGAFPAFSVGWHVSNERFMESVSATISNLKLRASYGLTGNNDFGNYAWISPLTQQKAALGNNLVTTYQPTGFTNRDLKWEKTKELDVGLDLGLFKSRIIFQGDYFNSESDNLLLNVPVPAITGFTNNFQNIGKLKNRGFEIGLTTHNLVGKFNWTTNINISHYQNKIAALGPDNAPEYYNLNPGLSQINKVGHPLYSFYTYVYEGVYKNQAEIDADPASYPGADPGNKKIKDVNHDGEITAADRTIVGSYEPDFTWSMTNTFNYRRFELSFMFDGVHGGKLYDHSYERSIRDHEGRNYVAGVVNRWRSPQNPGDGKHPKLTTELNGLETTGDSNWLIPGSYFRLSKITLGYTFKQTLLSKLGDISQLRLFITGQNLFNRTAGPIPDPESNNSNGESSFNTSLFNSGGVRSRGIIGYGYPPAKVYTIGCNVSF